METKLKTPLDVAVKTSIPAYEEDYKKEKQIRFDSTDKISIVNATKHGTPPGGVGQPADTQEVDN